MPKVRSPNYPQFSLGPALEAVRPAFKSENRNKMSRSVLAKHLGYNSLNGRSLTKIGAVRAYGLLDGAGDELRISDDAMIALNAPEGSSERVSALSRLALKPTLFQELQKDFPDTLPSLENLKFSLIKKQFTPDAAEKAAKSYLATMNLVAGIPDAYNPAEDDEEEAPETGADKGIRRTPPPLATPLGGKVKVMEGERIAFTEEGEPGQYLKLIASGEVDDTLLQALEDYVKRQRKRLNVPVPSLIFEPGQKAPHSAMYQFTHPNGHSPKSTHFFEEGEEFPPCTVCGSAARYVSTGVR